MPKIVKKRLYKHTRIKQAVTKKLLQDHPELKGYNIGKIVEEYNTYLLEVATTTREGVALPCYTGSLFVGGFLKKRSQYNDYRDVGLAMVYEKKGEAWSVHRRDGYEARLFYSTYTSGKFNRGCKWWGFEPTVATKKAVTAAYDNDYKKFIIVPNLRNIRTVFQTDNARSAMLKKQQEQLKTYNELDFSD